MKRQIFYFLLIFFLFNIIACKKETGHLCIKVIDGDTIETEEIIIRFIGIDAPEKNQKYYQEATDFLKNLVLNKKIDLEICPVRPRDAYNRTRCIVYLKDTNINIQMLRYGYAKISNIQPCHFDISEWQKYEDLAKKNKIGIWKE
ncbi:MAG: thermonuclease family protein [bacterium]